MRSRIEIVGAIFLTFITISCGKEKTPAVKEKVLIRGVQTEMTRLSPIEEVYEAVGTVRSKTASVLSSKVVGNIVAVHIREGDKVKRGQLLIEIDNRDAQTQSQKAKAALREANEGLQEIDQNIQAARSSRDAAEAGRSLAQATHNRYKHLLEENSVSRQEFDEVDAKLKVAEAELARAERTIESLLAKKRQIAAKVEQVNSDVASSDIYLSYSRIVSPIDGIISSKQAEVGLLASPGVPLLTVEDRSWYRLEAIIDESMIEKITLGSPAIVTVQALGDRKFSSRVSEIVPSADPSSRSSIVKLDLLGGKGQSAGGEVLRSGLYATALFPIGKKQLLLIPKNAIVRQGQLMAVLTVDPSKIVRLRLIKTGRSYAERIEVLSGLSEGDRVVVEGTEKIKEGNVIE